MLISSIYHSPILRTPRRCLMSSFNVSQFNVSSSIDHSATQSTCFELSNGQFDHSNPITSQKSEDTDDPMIVCSNQNSDTEEHPIQTVFKNNGVLKQTTLDMFVKTKFPTKSKKSDK